MQPNLFGFFAKNWLLTVVAGGLLFVICLSVLAPWIAPHDPSALSPGQRLKPMSAEFLLGTDAFGRDLFSRIIYGGRVSLLVGLGSAAISVLIGFLLGLLAGYFPMVDNIIMRVMDGLMAIPSILLAISIIAVSGASLVTVMVAIVIPEIPRTVRLVRAVVISAREEPYVEAAICLGTSVPKLLFRHIAPNTFAPLIVQATYVCAYAILTEAILSFLGAGISPEIPTWGNIMAEGRPYFLVRPSLIFMPGILLSLTILFINLIGDAVRDILDPRMQSRGA